MASRISAGKPLSTGKRTRWYHGARDEIMSVGKADENSKIIEYDRK